MTSSASPSGMSAPPYARRAAPVATASNPSPRDPTSGLTSILPPPVVANAALHAGAPFAGDLPFTDSAGAQKPTPDQQARLSAPPINRAPAPAPTATPPGAAPGAGVTGMVPPWMGSFVDHVKSFFGGPPPIDMSKFSSNVAPGSPLAPPINRMASPAAPISGGMVPPLPAMGRNAAGIPNAIAASPSAPALLAPPINMAAFNSNVAPGSPNAPMVPPLPMSAQTQATVGEFSKNLASDQAAIDQRVAADPRNANIWAPEKAYDAHTSLTQAGAPNAGAMVRSDGVGQTQGLYRDNGAGGIERWGVPDNYVRPNTTPAANGAPFNQVNNVPSGTQVPAKPMDQVNAAMAADQGMDAQKQAIDARRRQVQAAMVPGASLDGLSDADKALALRNQQQAAGAADRRANVAFSQLSPEYKQAAGERIAMQRGAQQFQTQQRMAEAQIATEQARPQIEKDKAAQALGGAVTGALGRYAAGHAGGNSNDPQARANLEAYRQAQMNVRHFAPKAGEPDSPQYIQALKAAHDAGERMFGGSTPAPGSPGPGAPTTQPGPATQVSVGGQAPGTGIGNIDRSMPLPNPTAVAGSGDHVNAVGTFHSQADLEHTAKMHGISVNEVKRRLGIS